MTSGTASEMSSESVTPTVANIVDWFHHRFDRVRGGDHVFAPAEERGVVVGENSGNAAQIETLDRVIGEALMRKADRHAARADRVGAIRKDRPEALGGAAEHAKAGIELKREAARRRRQRHAHELTDQRRAELAEVELKTTVEVGAVRLLARQRRQAVDDQSARSEQVRKQGREILHRRIEVERIRAEATELDASRHATVKPMTRDMWGPLGVSECR